MKLRLATNQMEAIRRACLESHNAVSTSRAHDIASALMEVLQTVDSTDKPLCASQYRDDWGHVWECEKEWGHWGTEPEKQHVARIPHGWQYANMSPLMVWPSSRAIK